MNETPEELRDQILDAEFRHHTDTCAWDGNEPIDGCTCYLDERRDRREAQLNHLIAAAYHHGVSIGLSQAIDAQTQALIDACHAAGIHSAGDLSLRHGAMECHRHMGSSPITASRTTDK